MPHTDSLGTLSWKLNHSTKMMKTPNISTPIIYSQLEHVVQS